MNNLDALPGLQARPSSGANFLPALTLEVRIELNALFGCDALCQEQDVLPDCLLTRSSGMASSVSGGSEDLLTANFIRKHDTFALVNRLITERHSNSFDQCHSFVCQRPPIFADAIYE
jgi:hypothetical protein